MQQLYLHPTWQQAVSAQDRALIEQTFDDTNGEVEDLLLSPVMRAAFNHKGQLLVTALVHNFSHHSVRFQDRAVTLQCEDFFEEQLFTIPALSIAPFTSMPWTFIFEPNEAYAGLPLDALVLEIYD